MPGFLFLFAFLLALIPGEAHAMSGVNFNWGTVCYSEAPVSHLSFACNTNATTVEWPMTMSFSIETEMTDMVGIEITVEGMSGAGALPDWWKLGTSPDCRAGRISYGSDKTAVSNATCTDWTGGTAFNVFLYAWDTNRAHISAGCAIDAASPVHLFAKHEYYAGTILLKNGKTVGTGSCSGCSGEMIWGLTLITVAGLDGRRDDICYTGPGGNQCLRWNGSALWCETPVRAPNCPYPTTTTLTTSSNPSVQGQPVTLSARVHPVAYTWGDVAFYDGAIELGRDSFNAGLYDSVATLVTSSLAEGQHALVARYLGDCCHNTREFLPSTSDTVPQTVLYEGAAVPPGRLELALESAPNPARGGRLAVAFTLPDAAPAQLALLDVGGRRLAAREVGTLGPGRHAMELGTGLAPGLYVVRLSRGSEARTVRVTLLE